MQPVRLQHILRTRPKCSRDHSRVVQSRTICPKCPHPIFRTAGSSAARAGQRIERIFRDMSIGWGHFGQIVRDWTAREWSREHFGLVEDVLKPDRLHRS